MVNLELYRVFYTVAKCGSLTKAADELFISQPAVSQSIKQLETQLGTPLFNRTHKGMELSAQGGEQIFKDVESALLILDDAENKLMELKNTATGCLRIGASDTIFEYFLSDKIVEFHRMYPAVKIELLSDVSPVTVEQLKTNKCDIAFLNMPIDADPDISIMGDVMYLHDIFVANDAFAELKDGLIPLRRLTEYPLLLLEQNTVARRAVSAYFGSMGLDLNPAIEVGSWDLMKRLAAKGMGIGCIPREYAYRALNERKDLFEVKTSPALPVRSVGMAFSKTASKSFALRKFMGLFNI